MAVAYLTGCFVNAAFAAYLLARAPRSLARSATLAVVIALALWQLGESNVLLASDAAVALVWIKLTYAALVLLAASFLFFTMAFPVARPAFWTRWDLRAAAAAPPVALLTLLLGPALVADSTVGSYGYARVEGPAFVLVRIYLTAYLLLALLVLLRSLGKARTRVQRAQCWYVLAGATAPVLLGVLDLMVLQPAGTRSFHYLVLPLTAVLPATAFVYALMRYHLFDVPGALKSGLMQAALVAMLLVPCLGLYVVAEHLLPGDLGGRRELVVALLLVTAGFVFPRIKVAAHRTLEETLFRRRSDYRHIIAAASHEIATILETRPLAATLSRRLREALAVEAVTIWVRDEAGYRAAGDGAAPRRLPAEATPALDAWIAAARGEPWSLDEPADGDRDVGQVLAGLAVALAFPLQVKERVLGVLALGPRASGRPYGDEEVSLLGALANQVAVAAENARLYEALKESKQLLQRASRLSAVGTLAAGLAHEIRNPLVAVQTFLQILPDRLDDPEVTGEFREVALAEMQRVSKLITELLGMARSPVANFQMSDLEDVVVQTLRLLGATAEKRGIRLLRSGTALPSGYADSSRLKQALLNLVMNALQASPEGSSVTVATRNGDDPAGHPFVEVTVRDEGPGIPAAHLDAVFHPFFTTKETGTGLGLAVTQQIVADHGGCIRVASEEGAGAAFIVQLPLEHEPPAEAPAPMLDGDGRRRPPDAGAPDAAAVAAGDPPSAGRVGRQAAA